MSANDIEAVMQATEEAFRLAKLDTENDHAALCDALLEEDEDDLFDAIAPLVMARAEPEFSADTTLIEVDAQTAVTNSARHDCVAWLHAPDQWKVGDNLPDGYVGRYYSKGAFGIAVCRWSHGFRDLSVEAIYDEHKLGRTLD